MAGATRRTAQASWRWVVEGDSSTEHLKDMGTKKSTGVIYRTWLEIIKTCVDVVWWTAVLWREMMTTAGEKSQSRPRGSSQTCWPIYKKDEEVEEVNLGVSVLILGQCWSYLQD